jgi:hypothetical protein
MEKIKTRLFSILLFVLVAGCLYFPLPVSAEKMTHTVKKGDTLWDICEQYYGDSSLWPKLWEMNSFITNPNLLSPGDVITLFEKVPQKAPEAVPEEAPVVEPPPVTGINIEAAVNNSKRIGFYSTKNVSPWGTVFAATENRLILAKDSTVYVIFEEGLKVSAGDQFNIGKLSPVTHPISNKKSGYVFDISGRLVIEKKAGLGYLDKKLYEKENSYQAKITETYEPVEIGDVLMPVNDISTCVLPASNDTDILANIVAGANKRTLFHRYSIVYMDKGTDAGVKKGNVFEIRMGNIVKDPMPEKTIKLYEELVVLPDRVLGRVFVIDTYPDSATAIVLSTTEPVEPGAYLKNVSWTETPDFIKDTPNCPIE